MHRRLPVVLMVLALVVWWLGGVPSALGDQLTLPVSIPAFTVWDMAGTGLTAIQQETPGVPGLETPTPFLPGVPTVPPVLFTPTTLPPPDLTPTLFPPGPSPTPPVPIPTATAAQRSNPMLNLLFARDRTAAMAHTPIIENDSGTTTESLDGFSAPVAGVSLANFYLTATFVNPDDTSTPWDVGIGFRDAGDKQEYRFVLDSSGAWFLSRGGQTPFDYGSIGNFDPNSGAVNTIEIIARGGSGMVAINGTVLKEIDLSAALNPGDIYVASGLFQDDVLEGREIEVQRISIYPLAS
jgi:hypothetical protein